MIFKRYGPILGLLLLSAMFATFAFASPPDTATSASAGNSTKLEKTIQVTRGTSAAIMIDAAKSAAEIARYRKVIAMYDTEIAVVNAEIATKTAKLNGDAHIGIQADTDYGQPYERMDDSAWIESAVYFQPSTPDVDIVQRS